MMEKGYSNPEVGVVADEKLGSEIDHFDHAEHSAAFETTLTDKQQKKLM
jgi:hypothetical protein